MLDLLDIQKDLERLKKNRDVLEHLLAMTGAVGAVVLELSGEPVVEAGAFEGDVSGFAARIATLWKAGQPVCRSLGEIAFEEISLMGSNHHLHIVRAGLNHLLGVAWDRETNLGLVRLYAAPSADRLGAMLAED
jgi:predicted regulator of Ras-like GTPase activity (Roadblock/LC7/MglB family)